MGLFCPAEDVKCKEDGMKKDRTQHMEPSCVCTAPPQETAEFAAFSFWQTMYLLVKRAADVAVSLAALFVLWPVFLLIALAIKWEDPEGTVLFKQKRVGRGGAVFCMYKFRSMKADTPELSTQVFVDANHYITRVGRFLRRTSLDELPQIWNVLEGTMSVIGPRPLIQAEQEVHRQRLSEGVYRVRPGITGLAQINGRDVVDDQTKVALDREYVEHLSLRQDLRIFLVTIFKVVCHADIVDAGEDEKRE